ncbi:MAG: hypothetical protein JO182_08980 [Acidobacteriaceae bacterium]|nr:hypothetical protein [Acidobacteriaceae bacterium]
MATEHPLSALPAASWDREFFEDPVVAELDAYREQHAAQFGFDIDWIVADIRSREPQELRLPDEKPL